MDTVEADGVRLALQTPRRRHTGRTHRRRRHVSRRLGLSACPGPHPGLVSSGHVRQQRSGPLRRPTGAVHDRGNGRRHRTPDRPSWPGTLSPDRSVSRRLHRRGAMPHPTTASRPGRLDLQCRTHHCLHPCAHAGRTGDVHQRGRHTDQLRFHRRLGHGAKESNLVRSIEAGHSVRRPLHTITLRSRVRDISASLYRTTYRRRYASLR